MLVFFTNIFREAWKLRGVKSKNVLLGLETIWCLLLLRHCW